MQQIALTHRQVALIDKLDGMKADYMVLWGIVCCYS